ncbi:hypothetical protein RB653_003032 [Dictyostelium firmibasis]|uniref:Uncharacterized protein n=1 Tax=Dictyostelium firmibasis TaxID=79012 RepID=A0AAN7TRH4_9MYCE
MGCVVVIFDCRERWSGHVNFFFFFFFFFFFLILLGLEFLITMFFFWMSSFFPVDYEVCYL